MFSEPKFTSHQSATFREFILLPRETRPGCSLSEVDLQSRLTDGFPLAIPFMSAAMESVTGAELAIALALQGALGVLPAGRVELDDQLAQVEQVKDYRGGFATHWDFVRADASLHQLEELEGRTTLTWFPVLDSQGRLVGEVDSTRYDPRALKGKVEEVMVPVKPAQIFSVTVEKGEIVDRMLTQGWERAYRVDEEGHLVTLVSRPEVKRELRFQDALRDEKGRLKVAVAVSTHPEDRQRARLAVAAGADAISVDASDGFSSYMQETVEYCKTLGVPVVAGNVVDRAGFEFLAACGADAVKVGIGSGSICTTRRVKAIGRGQATAVYEVAQARHEWAQKTGRYLPVISDGGLAGTGDMAVALALGADLLMMGKYFAGFRESPTVAYEKKMPVLSPGQETVGVTVKPYWGEASARAKNVRRYQQNDPRTFVIEGEEGFVLCKGSVHEGLPRDVKAIKGTLSSCGCRSLEEFQREVVLERQSVGSQQEGGISIFQG